MIIKRWSFDKSHHCRDKNGGEKTNQPNTKITFRTNEKHNLPLKKSTRKSGVLFLISPYANTPRAPVFIYGNLSALCRFNVCKSHHVCFRHMLVFSYINPPLSIYSNPTIRHFEIPQRMRTCAPVLLSGSLSRSATVAQSKNRIRAPCPIVFYRPSFSQKPPAYHMPIRIPYHPCFPPT